MISAGAVGFVVAPVVKTYGVEYLFATVIRGGIFLVALGVLGSPS